MAAAMFHRCQHCGLETDVSASLEVFEHDPRCGRVSAYPASAPILSHSWQCGLSASEGDMKMQDELATLMTQHLKFDTNVDYPHPPELPPTPQPEAPPQITYISQHYHHSAHQVAPAPSEQEVLQEELARHGINSQALLPTQLTLFRNAQPEQQLRLIQLWSIRPSERNNQTLTQDLTDWTQATMQQEEAAAEARYQRIKNETHHCCPEHRHTAEPYMTRGYEVLHPGENQQKDTISTVRASGYNRALDPAYQSREWWLHESDPIDRQLGQPQRQGADEDEEMS